VTASTTAVGYAADAPLRPDTYERWKPTALPATWTFDFGGSKTFDSIGIAGHNFADAAVAVLAEYQLGGDHGRRSRAMRPRATTPRILLLGSQ
jgi:hypothetical protein